jgi:hypothetical protein
VYAPFLAFDIADLKNGCWFHEYKTFKQSRRSCREMRSVLIKKERPTDI